MTTRSHGPFIFLFFALFPASSFAGFVGIEVLSQSHRISGEVYECDDIYTYSAFSDAPSGVHHAYPGDGGACPQDPTYGYAESFAGNFSVSTEAWGDGTAYSSATYVFRSTMDILRLSVAAEAWVGDPITRGQFRFSLFELNTGRGLLSFETPFCGWSEGYFVDCLEQGSYFIDSLFTFNTLPESVYRLDLYSYSTGSGNTSSASLLRVTVPEPAAFAMLLAGLLAVGLTRRRSSRAISA